MTRGRRGCSPRTRQGSRKVLDVGDLLGLAEGDNPHQWYSPSSVHRVIDQIVADYKQLDPKDSTYFDRQRTRFDTQDLRAYDRLMAAIRARYAGVPVGLQREHLPAAGRGARAQATDALQLREGDRRRNRRERRRQADRRRPSTEQVDQGVGLQQPERDARRSACEPARARSTHSDHHDHRNALTSLRYIRAMASPGASPAPAGPPPGDGQVSPAQRSTRRRMAHPRIRSTPAGRNLLLRALEAAPMLRAVGGDALRIARGRTLRASRFLRL